MTFCTSIHCMDGRIQEPIIQYLKKTYPISYVDTITEPGPNKIVAEHSHEFYLASIKTRVDISIQKHGSRLIAISGHHNCAGNPTDEATQKKHIHASIDYLKNQYPNVTVIGLWIDAEWTVTNV